MGGTANLRGALHISLANGFLPSGGDTFEVIDYTSHIGSFDSISGLNLAGGIYLEPQFNATNLVLVTVDTRPRPRFSQPVPLPGGALSATLTGIAGQTFIIQATTNFTSWQPVLTNQNAGATFDFIISDVTNYPHRFFRAVE